jgi:hypothetical protein
MYSRLVIAAFSGVLVKVLHKIGGFREIRTFGLLKDATITGSIIVNILVMIIFSELYWALDQDDSEEHFGFEDSVDAYYFSTVTSSSVGFGDVLPRSKKAKILVMIHIMTMFFVVLPIVLEALKPGN